MRIAFEVKLRDLLIYNVVHQFYSVPIHLFQAILPLLVLSFPEKGDDPLMTALMAAAAYLACWVFQIVFIIVYILSGNNRTLLTEKAIEIQDGALLEETRFNKSLHYWSGILKAVRRPGFIAIYTSPLAAHVIPHRAFLNEIERENFWLAVNLKLKDRSAAK